MVSNLCNRMPIFTTTTADRSRSRKVIVIGKVADLLILPIHHDTNRGENSLCFTYSGKRNFNSKKVCDITYMKNSLPSVIVECILPINAFLRCATAFRAHYIGKDKESLKKIFGS